MGTSHCRRLQLEISKQKIGRRKSTKKQIKCIKLRYDILYNLVRKWFLKKMTGVGKRKDIMCKRVVSDNVVCERAVCESLERVVCFVWKCCVWLCVWQILWQCCVWKFWIGKNIYNNIMIINWELIVFLILLYNII